MKAPKTLITLATAALFAVSMAFAAETKDAPKTTEAKAAACCAKAAKDGKACEHPCCIEAAKAGKNCEKCGGKGELAKKEEPKAK